MASLRYGSKPFTGRSDERVSTLRTAKAKGTGPGPGPRAGLNKGRLGDDATPSQPSQTSQSSQIRRTRPAMDSGHRMQKPSDGDASEPAATSLSRIPQASTARKPSLRTQPSKRPPLTHQDKPWSNTLGRSTTGSIRSATTAEASFSGAPSGIQSDNTKQKRRNVLRRKPSNLAEETATMRENSGSGSGRTDSSSSISRPQISPGNPTNNPSRPQLDRGLTESPIEIRVATKVEVPTTNAQTVRIYPELDRYRDIKLPTASGGGTVIEVPYPLSTQDLPPPTPLFSGTSSQLSGYSGSPSTRFSGSPGPWPYSRDTTPTTSISSQSPGLIAPLRVTPAPRVRQNSPATHAPTSGQALAYQKSRPPVTRRRAGSIPNDFDRISADPDGLAAVTEAQTSSSSNSTIRIGDKHGHGRKISAERENDRGSDKKKKSEPHPPSPPPRKSSQKFKKSRDEEPSPGRPAREPAQPIMTSPSPSKAASLATTSRTQTATQAVSSARGAPPVRPSRDGTPDLQSQLSVSLPVIHSNLSSTSLSERRQSIPLSATAPRPPMNNSRATTPSLQQDRPDRPQLHSRQPVGRELTPAPSGAGGRRPSNSEPTTTATPTNAGTARTPSPSVSTFRTRFGLFGRRAKTAPGAIPQIDQQKEKSTTRKGPVAGTGHEGYGRVGAVHRRRSSSTANFARGLAGATISSQSKESLEMSLSCDPFILERMNPVVIAGGEVIKNRNVDSELSRTESNQSTLADVSRTASEVSLSSREERHTLWPSALSRGTTSRAPSRGSRRPSDSSDSEALAMRSTLAFRRSVQKLKGSDQSAVRLPKPIVVHSPHGVTSPAITSYDTSLMSDDSAFGTTLIPAGLAMEPQANATTTTATSKKLAKRAKSPRRWNFFGRSSSQPAATTKRIPESRTVAATVKAVQPSQVESKPVAFYTMMDSSEQEDGDLADIQDLLYDSNLLSMPPSQDPPQHQTQSPAKGTRRPSVSRSISNRSGNRSGNDASEATAAAGYVSPNTQWADMQVVSAPEPITVAVERPGPTVRRTGRPSRLPQVGRIPKVVSARPEQTSPKSFSRPFNRISFQMPPPKTVIDSQSVAKGPTPPRSPTPEEPQQPDQDQVAYREFPVDHTTQEESMLGGTTAPDSRCQLSREFSPNLSHSTSEFLSFSPPRKNSECTTCTTTSTSSGMLSYADATAVIPVPGAPLAEDEIWAEYDDLLGDDGLRVPPSAGSSQGTPFYLEGYAERLAKQAGKCLESPTVAHHYSADTGDTVPNKVDIQQDIDVSLRRERKKEPVASSVYSTDTTDRLNQALETGVIPISSPFSISEFVSGYADHEVSVESLEPVEPLKPLKLVKQSTAPSPVTTVAQRGSTSSTRSPHRQRVRTSDASVSTQFSQLSEDNSPLSQVNLRVGSMTVSKWLTFGHVLFSPVRDDLVPEVGSLKRHSILVIDGLGNDDWSFYAAETYPAATFFNLSPRAPIPADRRNSSTGITAAASFPLSPPNHHQIQYKSHLDKFPFAPESFTAVVYRFPAAAPESHYRNAVSEARRVLKPGGYIELSILDLDLNNMGNRSRRVVRRLKERIHASAPDTSLGSTADLLLRLLGRRGFTDIKSCRVGVPVASSAITAASSSSSGSEASSNNNNENGQKTVRGQQSKGKRDNRSLAEMMRDESPVADESITKMVAKVGRWWFSRCYEGGAVGSIAASIWNDRALLSECEEWRTSLKLMVCHAKVPDGRTRVASI